MRPKTSTILVGAAAESLAADYLQQHGLNVVERNLRCKAGEIDLVCLDGETLVMVEVRKRSRADFGGALTSITPLKRAKLIRATRFHWQRRPEWHARYLRFDVVALQTSSDGTDDIEWVQDAFRAAV